MSDNGSLQPQINLINTITSESWQLFRQNLVSAAISGLVFLITLVLMVLPMVVHFIHNFFYYIFYLIIVFIIPTFYWASFTIRTVHRYHLHKKATSDDVHIFMVARYLHLFTSFLFVIGITDAVYIIVKPFPIACVIGFAAVLPMLAYAVMGDNFIRAFKNSLSLFWHHPLVVSAVAILPFFIMILPGLVIFSLPLHIKGLVVYLMMALPILWVGLLAPWSIYTSIVLQSYLDKKRVADFVAMNQEESS